MAEKFLEERENAYRVIQIYDKELQTELLLTEDLQLQHIQIPLRGLQAYEPSAACALSIRGGKRVLYRL